MNTSHPQPFNDAEPIAIRPDAEIMTRQKLPYFVGISGQTAKTKGLSMHLVVIPPGQVETRYGKALEKSCISRAGDFLFIPPGVPHTAINLSQTQPARAIVARNDPNEQENVVPYSIQSDRDREYTDYAS